MDLMWLAVGLASLIVALAVAFACARAGRAMDGLCTALDKLGTQLDLAQGPLTETLARVGSVASHVDAMVGRANRVTEVAEKTAGAVAKTADAAQAAVTPAVVNLAGIMAGVSQGARAFFNFRKRNGNSQDGAAS
jgi:hypothetical protein